MNYTVILFYKYVQIDNPQELMASQRVLCEKLDLKGRVLIAEEGINGTLEGESQNIERYIEKMREDSRFVDVEFKKSVGTGNAFPKLKIKVRPEIVTTKLGKEIDPTKDTGIYLEPEELQKWYEEGRDFTIIDMRNDYEYASGYFEKSVPSGMKNFFELVNVPDEHASLKEKTVLTVCTGGVRCEKASAYLKYKGFKDVYQLHGGMHRYMEKFPNQNFKGTLYVFDNRMTTDLGAHGRSEVVGVCVKCGDKTERYTNCAFDACHKQILQCQNCSSEKIFCSEDCKEKV
jgi:UPF0176 protein